jgi:hypothetical protein
VDISLGGLRASVFPILASVPIHSPIDDIDEPFIVEVDQQPKTKIQQTGGESV